jgi:hypothetical protein
VTATVTVMVVVDESDSISDCEQRPRLHTSRHAHIPL